MPMDPEFWQILEVSLDGIPLTLETMMSLPEGKKKWVWDPWRNQPARVIRREGGLKIETGDLEHPEHYSIDPEDALNDALDLQRRVRTAEGQQQNEFIKNAPF